MPKKAVKKSVVIKKTTPVGGRPRVDIDYDKLDELCGLHCNGEECASLLGVDYDTLNSELKKKFNYGFSDYFAIKSASGKRSLRRSQYVMAVGVQSKDKPGTYIIPPNPTMSIWLGKQWLKQSEKTDLNVSGELSLNKLSDEQIEALLTEKLKGTKK